jgi:hypothetical protein
MTIRGVAPALLLFVLSPFIGEFLLGSMAIEQWAAFPVVALLYGGGAVFIREVSRRSGRGWPTMATLGLAYAVFEEALTTQSLFNPNYAGLRLLDRGFIPALGIGASWTLYVLTIHVVWSVSLPIALVEALVSGQRTTPWLGGRGLSVVTLLFVLGAVAVTLAQTAQFHFTASVGQFAASAGLIALLVTAAFLCFAPSEPTASPTAGLAPSPWVLGLLACAAGSAFHLLKEYAPALSLSVAAEVVAILAIEGAMAGLVVQASRRTDWSERHRFALAAGGTLVYGGWGFVIVARLHPASAWAQPLWLFLAIALLVLIARRLPGR